MAPLPPNTTQRVYVDYTTGRYQHTFVVRINAVSVPTDGLVAAGAFLGAVQTLLPTQWAVLGARYSAAGSDITLPLGLGPLDGFQGTAGVPLIGEVNEPVQVNWIGRSPQTGRRVRVGLYGLSVNVPPQFRLVGAARPAPIAQAAFEIAGSVGQFVTIDGSDASWYDYVNFNYNSYWETEARG